MGFASLEAANEWLLVNQQRTAAGLHFDITSPTNIDFTVQANTTIKTFRATTQDPIELVVLPLQVAAHREIVRCARLQCLSVCVAMIGPRPCVLPACADLKATSSSRRIASEAWQPSNHLLVTDCV